MKTDKPDLSDIDLTVPAIDLDDIFRDEGNRGGDPRPRGKRDKTKNRVGRCKTIT
jgi:hypothetical protein